MSIADNKSIVRRAMEALDHRDVNAVIAECAPDMKWHGFAPTALNNEGYRQAIQVFLDAFPDSRFAVDVLIAEGDQVVAQHKLSGTHNGPFQNVSATGNSVVVPAFITFRLSNDKIVEAWLNAEMVGLLIQIGAIPSPI